VATFQLEEARRRQASAASTQVEPDQSTIENHPAASSRVSAEQQWVVEVRAEIDDYMILLRKLRSLPPEQVFLELSGITARMAEIRMVCVRSESRRLAALRTREIDPLIEECDRQFRFHSRIQAVRSIEWDQTRNLT
jgi:hypothetical protein